MTSWRDVLKSPPWLTFEAQTRSFAIGRSIIALAQLTLLVFTPPSQYFQPILGEPDSPQCGGVLAATAYCIADKTLGLWLGHVLCGLVVVAVISGVYPRWTAWLHVWVTFSIGFNFALTDGGETVAQFATLLIAIVSVADTRRNHWQATVLDMGQNRRALSWVGWNAARIQLAFIYFYSAGAKLSVDRWVDGSAFYYFVRDPMFGASGPLKTILVEATRNPVFVAGLTWSGIVLQFAIAILILRGPKSRLVALGIDCVLHIGILSAMGLWSFSLTMIGFAVFCCGSDLNLLSPSGRQYRKPSQEQPRVMEGSTQ